MEENNISKKFLQSYLFSEYGKFFVSTCYRRSSSDPFVWFYETFAWKLDKENHRTDWIADNSGSTSQEGAYDQHIEVIRQLEKIGEFKEVKVNERIDS